MLNGCFMPGISTLDRFELTRTGAVICSGPITVASTNPRVGSHYVVATRAFQCANGTRLIGDPPPPPTALRLDKIPRALEVAVAWWKQRGTRTLAVQPSLCVDWFVAVGGIGVGIGGGNKEKVNAMIDIDHGPTPGSLTTPLMGCGGCGGR